MARLIMFLSITLFILGSLGLFHNLERAQSDSSDTIGDLKLYTFSSDDQQILSNPQPFLLPPDTTLKETLNSLGRDLAENYFAETYMNTKTDIRFEVLQINKLSTPSRHLRIAVINMVDSNRDAMESFFQGSTGSQITFCILAATFVQPHLDPPLLDGLILLYNGELLPELDHINLSGILTPRLVQYVVQKAIKGTKKKSIDSTQNFIINEHPDYI